MPRFLIAAFAILSSVTGACGERDDEAIAGPKEGVKVFFALKQVHPENETFLRGIEYGDPVPPDYAVFPTDEVNYGTGEIIGEQPILLKKTNIITADMVENASLLGDDENSIIVQLTKKGAARLSHATKQMRLTIDRIAVVFEDRCIIAPTVAVELNDSFLIQGLLKRAEADRVVKLLNARAQK